ncbi:2074_t:CDS:2 [Dentiscutata erythropus]|uniref:2074_t:CDS:1 n=1 Tax=Dentiscutata erythropus TaxID=1348616 RepID=A0A9N9AJ48_9GLOM|nr:2074_t:CDS:2 [Dentiscutata erythropus]
MVVTVKVNSQATGIITPPTTSALISHPFQDSFIDSIDKLEPFIYAFLMIIIIALFALSFRFCRDKNKSDDPEKDVDITPREVRKSKKSLEKSLKLVIPRSIDKALTRNTSGDDLLLRPPLPPTPPTPTTPTSLFEEERPPLARTPTTVSSFTEIFDSNS